MFLKWHCAGLVLCILDLGLLSLVVADGETTSQRFNGVDELAVVVCTCCDSILLLVYLLFKLFYLSHQCNYF